MNFRVVDGDRDYLEYAWEFAKLYNDCVRVADILDHFNIGRNQYNLLREFCRDEGLINSDRKNYQCRESYKRASYVHRHYDAFEIKRTVNGKVLYFGRYRKYEDAVKVRDRLVECN